MKLVKLLLTVSFISASLSASLFANYENNETKLAPDELSDQNKANIPLVDTLSIKAGYSKAFTKRTDDNGGVYGVIEPEKNGMGLAIRAVFNSDYIPYFKPYIDFTTMVYDDRNFYIPSVGLRYDFELDSRWIEPYASFGIGYARLNRKSSPLVGAYAVEDTTASANLTLESGVDFYITDNIALDLSLRYDIYNATTTIAGNQKLTTLYDTSSLSVMAGLVYRFGKKNSIDKKVIK